MNKLHCLDPTSGKITSNPSGVSAQSGLFTPTESNPVHLTEDRIEDKIEDQTGNQTEDTVVDQGENPETNQTTGSDQSGTALEKVAKIRSKLFIQ